MLKKIATTLIAASGILCAVGTANAQYVGPSQATSYRNVAEILKNPVDDVRVTLRGKVTSRLSDDMYQFTDGTGTISVEIFFIDFHADGAGTNSRTVPAPSAWKSMKKISPDNASTPIPRSKSGARWTRI